jgi:hypothetical protein
VRFGVRFLRVTIAALLAACSRPTADTSPLATALRTRFGASTEPRIALVRGPHHLSVRLHGSWVGVPEPVLDAEGREVASLVVHNYPQAATLDSLTVSFLIAEDAEFIVARNRRFGAAALRALQGQK